MVKSITSEQLAVMTDEQLIAWCDQELSIPIPAGTPRGVIYTRIVNASMSACDGLVL